MIKHIIFILTISISINITAQKDTLYFKLDDVFNTNWLSATKENAQFYRPMPLKKVGELYELKDYFVNGTLYMEGLSSHPNRDHFTGNIIWYYKNGNKQKEAYYKNLELNGLVKTYFKDGTLKTEGTYKNDKALNGTFFSCYPCYVVERKNGKRIGGHQFYKNSKVIAEKYFNDENEHTYKRIAFDKNGKQIAEVTVEPINTNIDGKAVLFDIDEDKNITKIYSIANYKNKKLHGESIDYDSNENILAKGTYQNGYPYSGTIYHHLNDVLKSYQEGVLEGEEIAYSKGKIIAKGINKEGYHWNGRFKSGNYEIITVKNWQLDGKQTTYYVDGNFKLTDIKSYHYIINGVKEGESAYFNEKGKRRAKGIYKNDKPWQGTFYDEYYNVLMSFKEGQKHGVFIYYGFDGKIAAKQQFKDGQLIE